jgi:hypothetical protein
MSSRADVATFECSARKQPMSRNPAVNTNPHAIADKAKYEYVGVTEQIGAMHDRLTELAEAGRLDADESESLQDDLFLIWESVCRATIFAAAPDKADWEGDWDTLAEDWNTYSDGRTVVTRVRMQPRLGTDPNSARNQEDNTYLHLSDTGDEGVVCHVAHPDPADDQFLDDAPQRLGF